MEPKRGLLFRTPVLLAGLLLGLHTASLRAPGQDATERILSFHSDITVNPDASMRVEETIKVRAAGEQIKHGIFRDFPTRYRDRLANPYVLGFEVQEVRRDGKPEPFHTEKLGNGVRVYIGDKDVFLDPGEHTYTLVYATNRQLGFFPDHDELYWNVTGNGWIFPIDEASATVALPGGIKRDALLLDGFTGPQGSLGTAFTWSVDGDARPTFTTTRPLAPGEGLTIVVSWPKGFVLEPTREMKIRWFLEDNASTLAGLIGLVVLLVYYIVVWAIVGKDPSRGVIMTLYEPPAGLSPAAVRYLQKMGFDDKTFAAAVINMAVARYLAIEEKDGEYTLKRAQAHRSALAADEKSVAEKLLGSATQIKLETANHAKISAAIQALKTALRMNLEKIYFLANRAYLIPGLLFSVLALAFVALAAPGESKVVALFLMVWLTGWSVGVYFLLSQALHAWRGYFSSPSHKVVAFAGAVGLSVMALPFVAGEIGGLVALAYTTSGTVILILLAMVAVNCLFHHLLKAPTHAGRKLMDQIEGFKMFLSAVEKDRLNMLNPPRLTPQLFEKYLPYALALDVEQQWSEQFAEALAQVGERAPAYSPTWYSGSSWGSLGAGGFASSFGSSFSSAISSSSTAPGSSSGGSGGSSGGGGGGGGGGGW